jgi:hypothetical protein
MNRIPMKEYRNAPGANWSSFKHAFRGASFAKWKRDNPTAGSQEGRLVHALVLDPDSLYDEFAFSPYDNFRTKEAQAWKAEQEATGKDVVANGKLQEFRPMCERAVNGTALGNFLSHPEAMTEHSLFATLDVGGRKIAVKARLDLYVPGVACDLKTTDALTPQEFVRSEATKLHYVGQAAFYSDVAAACGLDVQEWIWFCLNLKTGDTFGVRCPQDALAAGRALYRKALLTYVEAQEAGVWAPACDPTLIHDVEFNDYYLDRITPEAEGDADSDDRSVDFF